ncbi:MAG TPA: AMP-binding protein [Actinomycetota bacterium]|nr:AMP-binding protein [Actinomycetota bacterium]
MMELSYVHGATDVPLLGETIGRHFDRIALAHPDSEALVSRHQGVRFTYGELHAEVQRVARGLMALGVDKGDRVGIWSSNNAEWLVTQYATATIGAILVNINPAYRTYELEYALEQSGVSMLIAARAFRQTDYVAMLHQLVAELDHAKPGDISSQTLPDLRTLVLLGDGETESHGAFGWEDVLDRAEDTPEDGLRERKAGLEFDDAINIQYTSGTTGFPKGATLSHHNILNNGFFIGERMKLTPADRICLPVPLYHCFGMVLGNLAAMTHASCIILPADAFEPKTCLETVEAEGCTALYGVPTMFIAELEHPEFAEFRLDTLRTGIMAGSPCPVEVMRKVIDRMHMTEVTICYGMTETSPVSFQSNTDDDLELRVSTVGAIHPHVEVKMIDADGHVVPRGEPGELCTRGYPVMLGYWNSEEETREAIDAARWMHTGDLAVMTDQGYANIVGRIKDMIIRGGENVYPREIEEFLYGHPKIADVQVIGVPDVKYGEEICACVELKDGEQATEEEIQEYCRGRIASFKIPRYVRFVDEFPMTVTGKVQKFKMRDTLIDELGLQEAASVSTA